MADTVNNRGLPTDGGNLRLIRTDRALGRALAELNRLRLLEVLRVHPLEPDETARLAAAPATMRA